MDRRKYPSYPIIGVGGVIFQEEQVLLIKRAKEPNLGQWSIPGGAVKTGETLREALLREVREETHLEVEILGLAKIFDRIVRSSQGRVTYHYVLADYVCRYRSGELQSDSDAQEARFVSLQDLSSYPIPAHTLEVIKWADYLRKNTPMLSSLSRVEGFPDKIFF